MITKDRLIVIAAALPAVLSLGLALVVTRDLIVSGVVAVVCGLLSAAVSLSPPVKRARIRLLRRKYPVEEQNHIS